MTTDTDVPTPVKRAAEKLQQLSADENARELAWDRERALIDWQIERNTARAEGEAEAKQTIAASLRSKASLVIFISYVGSKARMSSGAKIIYSLTLFSALSNTVRDR